METSHHLSLRDEGTYFVKFRRGMRIDRDGVAGGSESLSDFDQSNQQSQREHRDASLVSLSLDLCLSLSASLSPSVDLSLPHLMLR
jgi:hypothetical protein